MTYPNHTVPVIAISLFIIVALVPLPLLVQDVPHHHLVPFETIPSEQWVEVVSGDPGAPGEPFVLRLHNDAGFVVLPHTHPEVEHIVVIEGRWALGKGSEYDPSTLEPMQVGDYAMVPGEMAHFAHSITQTTVQVHGIGPFAVEPVHPVYELTNVGVGLFPLAAHLSDTPVTPDVECFQLEICERVQGHLGEGAVVGAHCTPAIEFTQYWVEQ